MANEHGMVVWVTAQVPPNAPPGRYGGQLQVPGGGTVPVTLKVGAWAGGNNRTREQIELLERRDWQTPLLAVYDAAGAVSEVLGGYEDQVGLELDDGRRQAIPPEFISEEDVDGGRERM